MDYFIEYKKAKFVLVKLICQFYNICLVFAKVKNKI